MAGLGRFELPTCRSGGDRSIHLSYRRVVYAQPRAQGLTKTGLLRHSNLSTGSVPPDIRNSAGSVNLSFCAGLDLFRKFFNLFGLDALPYHAFVMGTQFANLLLLSWIVRKLGGSRLAACAAPVLWVANAALVVPLGWASDYNQILCAFFLLSAFALFLAGHYWLQFAVFVIGFGALEINVVYPAILMTWLLLSRKDLAAISCGNSQL